MRKLLIIPVLLIFVSCSSIKIAYDFDKEADFSKYKTYEFSEETLNLKIDQLNRNRLIKAVETEMATKGFTKSENADAIIDLRLKGKEIQTATATTTGAYGGYGYRYGRWGYGGGFANTQINYDKYVEGTLFITLIDKAGQKVIWQGTGTKTIDEKASPQKREENINYAVKQIFSNYPPGAK
jgi:hypothetical protein